MIETSYRMTDSRQFEWLREQVIIMLVCCLVTVLLIIDMSCNPVLSLVITDEQCPLIGQFSDLEELRSDTLPLWSHNWYYLYLQPRTLLIYSRDWIILSPGCKHNLLMKRAGARESVLLVTMFWKWTDAFYHFIIMIYTRGKIIDLTPNTKLSKS